MVNPIDPTATGFLLAVLAVAPFGSRTRSELRELFWASSTEEDARHALSQALYYLRRSLGQSAIDVEGDVVLQVGLWIGVAAAVPASWPAARTGRPAGGSARPRTSGRSSTRERRSSSVWVDGPS